MPSHQPSPIMFVDCGPKLSSETVVKSETHDGSPVGLGVGGDSKKSKFMFVNKTSSSQLKDSGEDRQSIRSFVMCRARKARLWSTSRKKGKLADDDPANPSPTRDLPASRGRAKDHRAKRHKAVEDSTHPAQQHNDFGHSFTGSEIPNRLPAWSSASLPASPGVSPWIGNNSSLQATGLRAFGPDSSARTGVTMSDYQGSFHDGHISPPPFQNFQHPSSAFGSTSFTIAPDGSYAILPTTISTTSHSDLGESGVSTSPVPSPMIESQPQSPVGMYQHSSIVSGFPRQFVHPPVDNSPARLSTAGPYSIDSSAASLTSHSSVNADASSIVSSDFDTSKLGRADFLTRDNVASLYPQHGQDVQDLHAVNILRSWIRKTRPGIPSDADPLSTLPVSLQTRDIRLLYLFVEVLSPISVPLAHFGTIQAYGQVSIRPDYPLDKPLSALAKSWLSSAFTSKAFLYALLCSVAVFDYLTAGESGTDEIVSYHGSVISALADSLDSQRINQSARGGNHPHIFENPTIGTVWQLLCIQEGVQSLPDLKDALKALTFVGSQDANDSLILEVASETDQQTFDSDQIDFRRAHSDGFLHMLDLRGGIEALESDKCLQAMILWHQCLHSVSAVAPFAFPVPSSLIHTSGSALRSRGLDVMNESSHPFAAASPLRYLTDLDPPLPTKLVALAESTVSLARSLNQWFDYNKRNPSDAWRQQDAALELHVHVCRLVSCLLDWIVDEGPGLDRPDPTVPAWIEVRESSAVCRNTRDGATVSAMSESRTSKCSSSSCSVVTVPPVSNYEIPSDEHLGVIASLDFDQASTRPNLHHLHKILSVTLLIFVVWNSESADSIPQESSVLHLEAFNQAKDLLSTAMESIVNAEAVVPPTAVSSAGPSSDESRAAAAKVFIARVLSVDYPLAYKAVESNILLWILTVLAVTSPPSTQIDPLTEEQVRACKQARPVHQPIFHGTGKIAAFPDGSQRSGLPPPGRGSHAPVSPFYNFLSSLDAVFPSDRAQPDESTHGYVLRVWRTTCLRLGIWSLEELRLRLFTSVVPIRAAELAGNRIGMLNSILDKESLARDMNESRCPLWVSHRMDGALEQLWITWIEPGLPDFVPRL